MSSLRFLGRALRSLRNPVMQAAALYLVFLAAALAGAGITRLLRRSPRSAGGAGPAA